MVFYCLKALCLLLCSHIALLLSLGWLQGACVATVISNSKPQPALLFPSAQRRLVRRATLSTSAGTDQGSGWPEPPSPSAQNISERQIVTPTSHALRTPSSRPTEPTRSSAGPSRSRRRARPGWYSTSRRISKEIRTLTVRIFRFTTHRKCAPEAEATD